MNELFDNEMERWQLENKIWIKKLNWSDFVKSKDLEYTMISKNKKSLEITETM